MSIHQLSVPPSHGRGVGVGSGEWGVRKEVDLLLLVVYACEVKGIL